METTETNEILNDIRRYFETSDYARKNGDDQRAFVNFGAAQASFATLDAALSNGSEIPDSWKPKAEDEDADVVKTSKLVLQVMGAMVNDSNRTSGSLIDNLTKQNKHLRAELMVIRNAVRELFEKPFMPTPRMVIACLYPSDAEVDEVIEYGD